MGDVMPLTERLRHKVLAIRTCAPRARSAKIAEDDAVAMEAAAAEIERLTRERDALRSEVENLKNWREDAEKYIESLTTMVVKQRDRAEKAEELLRAYEVVVIRREEDGNSR